MTFARRHFLRGSGSAVFLLSVIGTGLLRPVVAHAAEWQRSAFTAKNIQDALKAYTREPMTESRLITINAPEIAENGAKVGIEIICNQSDVRSLAVFSDKNPMPLCATLEFAGNAVPYARLELKLSESTRLRVVAKTTDGKHLVAFRDIQVTLGGCGG